MVPSIFKTPDFKFEIYHKTTFCARIEVVDDKVVCYKPNPKVYKLWLPFPVWYKPTVRDCLDYLESRCVPRTRANVEELLEGIGLKEYDPLAIVKITHGISRDDFEWIKFDGEDLHYEDVKIRD